jgi:hypothetical protein
MLNTLWAVIHNGKIELPEQVDLPEGTRLLVTILPDDEAKFWLLPLPSHGSPAFSGTGGRAR